MRRAVLPLALVASALTPATQFDVSSRGQHPVPPPKFGPSTDTRRAAFLGPDRPTNLVRATLLAQAYFTRYLRGCGFAEAGRDAGDRWSFSTRVGFSGVSGPEIGVDKSTGTTAADGLPAVTDPKATYGPPKIDRKAEARRLADYVRGAKRADGVLRRIGPRQEIGEYEAWLMASAYFTARFGACGGITMPRSDPQRWIAHTTQGAAGRPDPDIFIDRSTGDTWAKGHLHIANPRAYAKPPNAHSAPAERGY